LVVITIIGLIMGLVGPRVLNYLSESKVKAATIQIQSFASSLDLFYLDLGRYPSTSEGLVAWCNGRGSKRWNGPYLKNNAVPNDPWDILISIVRRVSVAPMKLSRSVPTARKGEPATPPTSRAGSCDDGAPCRERFYLLETICVLAVIAMLAAIVLPGDSTRNLAHRRLRPMR